MNEKQTYQAYEFKGERPNIFMPQIWKPRLRRRKSLI
jgi:hypothetical protein